MRECIIITLLFGVTTASRELYCFNDFNITENFLNTELYSINCFSSSITDLSKAFKWLSSNPNQFKLLDFSHNNIEVVPVFPNYQNVTYLNLEHNKIQSIEDYAFANLENLKSLFLSHNAITGNDLRPNVFRGNLTTYFSPYLGVSSSSYEYLPIEVLDLGYNKIESISHLSVFEKLPRLRELHLNGNPLNMIDYSLISAIQSVNSLRVLSLARTNMYWLPDGLFKNMKITSLYLNGNKFTAVPEQLAELEQTLQFLDINENPISTLDSRSFVGLTHLSEIVIAGMSELVGINAGTFAHLKNLKVLTISYNPRLEYIDPHAFHNFNSKIKTVYLNNNNLRHLSEYSLPWNQLEKLELSGNHWACDCNLKWITEVEKKNNSILLGSGLTCSEPTWLNGTKIESIKKPFSELLCIDEPPEFYAKKIVTMSLIDLAIIVAFLGVSFFTIGLIVTKCFTKGSRDRVIEIMTLTYGKEDNTKFKYNKLNETPVYIL